MTAPVCVAFARYVAFNAYGPQKEEEDTWALMDDVAALTAMMRKVGVGVGGSEGARSFEAKQNKERTRMARLDRNQTKPY